MGSSRNRVTVPYVCFDDERPVYIPADADVTKEFRPSGKYASHVAAALKRVRLFGEKPFVTLVTRQLPVLLPLRTVQIDNEAEVTWGRYLGHQVAHQDLLPFVRLPHPPKVRVLTIRVTMHGRTPRLISAHAGAPEAPLPWAPHAAAYEGGSLACKDYWARHAIVLRPGIVSRSTLTATPPNWAR